MPGGAVQPKTVKQSRNNYASRDCGAKVLAANREAQNSNSILNGNKDDYMTNPCTAKKWWDSMPLLQNNGHMWNGATLWHYNIGRQCLEKSACQVLWKWSQRSLSLSCKQWLGKCVHVALCGQCILFEKQSRTFSLQKNDLVYFCLCHYCYQTITCLHDLVYTGNTGILYPYINFHCD